MSSWSADDFGGPYQMGRRFTSKSRVHDSDPTATRPMEESAILAGTTAPQTDDDTAVSLEWFVAAQPYTNVAQSQQTQQRARFLHQRSRDYQAQQKASVTAAPHSSNENAVVSEPDFGYILGERVARAHWLQRVRSDRDAQSDYERYSLEYILRRRYDAQLIAETDADARRAVEWECTVLCNAMQAAADRALHSFDLVLRPDERADGYWCDSTLRTVREPDLFGRAVCFLLDTLGSRAIRVRYTQADPQVIRLCLSWDECLPTLCRSQPQSSPPAASPPLPMPVIVGSAIDKQDETESESSGDHDEQGSNSADDAALF